MLDRRFVLTLNAVDRGFVLTLSVVDRGFVLTLSAVDRGFECGSNKKIQLSGLFNYFSVNIS
jgi:hypothetical protein